MSISRMSWATIAIALVATTLLGCGKDDNEAWSPASSSSGAGGIAPTDCYPNPLRSDAGRGGLRRHRWLAGWTPHPY